jgi:HK97 family phage portal protein
MQLFKRNNPEPDNLERRGLLDDGDIFSGLAMISEYGQAAGVTVTPDTAITASAVLACVGRISRDIATLPVHVLDRESGKRVGDHPVAQLLRSPNEYQTPVAFWTAYIMNTLLWGNGYAAIERAGSIPTAILPMLARDTRPGRRDGQLFYATDLVTGSVMRPDQVLHTPYLALDGIAGRGPIQLATQTVGMSIALADFAARYFSQGSHLDANAFELPPMKGEALTELRRQLKEQFSGPANQHQRLALPGLKVHRLHYSMRDNQATESRQFQLREVARIFAMPVGIIDPVESTYGNLENQYRDYAQACLRPHVVAIEQEVSRKLFSEAEQSRYTIRFNLDAVVRSSLADRMEADAKGVQAGILTANEARAHHDLPPIDGGDTLMSPLNMAPADGRKPNNQRSAPPPAPEVRTPQADRPADPEQRDDRVQILIESIASGIAIKEANAATRAAKKPEEFRGWASEFFGQGHVDHLVERLPIVSADQATALAAEARDQLLAAQEAGTLDELLESWPANRPKNISMQAAA